MKKKCLFEKINDQKGAAAVITLSVILVLTALGTIALAVSTMSVKMSSKTVSWSDEYYTMDCIAEDYLNQIDQVIADAEKDARLYVKYRLDRISYDQLAAYMSSKSISFTYDYKMDDSSNGAQRFFNEYYKSDWVLSVPSIHEITLDDYQAYRLAGNLGDISKSHTGSMTAEEAFEKDLSDYVSQLFDRVYYHMVSIRLLRYTDGPDTLAGPGKNMQLTQNVVLKGGSASYGDREDTPEDRCTNNYINIIYDPSNMQMIWSTFNPTNPAAAVGLYVRVAGGTAADPKQVRVELDVTLPDYQTVTKYIHTPIYGNPLLTNALSAQGTVTFAAGITADPTDVEIVGDVYSSDTNGISINSYADVKIRGNVYTPGDIKVIGDNGKLTVDTAFTDPVPAISYDFKQKTYENNYFYDNAVNDSVIISQYAPGGATNQMPFVFFDNIDQGNVYCDSVFVGSDDVEVNIKGNLWTKDDIQLDANGSTIRIGHAVTDPTGKTVPKYNYIGLSAESAIKGGGEINHRASSSVINNYPYTPANMPSSEIVMNSNMIVPGVAFYEFPDGSVYMSVESVTSRTSNPVSIINAYLHDPANPSEAFTPYTNADGVQIDLIDANLLVKRQRLIDFIKSTKPEYGSLKTNINSDLNPDTIDGYIAGIALVNTNDPSDLDPADDVEMFTHEPYVQDDVSKLINSRDNYIAFSYLYNNNTLKKIFYSKTRKLGTKGSNVNSTDAVPFSDFLDSTITNPYTYFNGYEIKVVPAGDTLDVNAVSEGIVYCNGNLTISDNDPTTPSEFRGTIICTGNVTIRDNVRLIYDEFEILEKLKNYYKVRKFFEDISETYFKMKMIDEIDLASDSGERNVVKRLRIKSWKEVPIY